MTPEQLALAWYRSERQKHDATYADEYERAGYENCAADALALLDADARNG